MMSCARVLTAKHTVSASVSHAGETVHCQIIQALRHVAAGIKIEILNDIVGLFMGVQRNITSTLL